MKRVIVFFLSVSLILFNSVLPVYAGDTDLTLLSQNKIAVYLDPDVTVELNGVKQIFRDSNGDVVFPIIYDGSTYLPVRAVSELMKESIEWDAASKTIFIGKTLSNPNKNQSTVSTSAILVQNDKTRNVVMKAKTVTAYLKHDVLVMYDFEIQNFVDADGNKTYPVVYNGTTYLPVHAISELMKEPVEWDGVTKIVTIGDGNNNTKTDATTQQKETSPVAKALKDLFEREEILYYDATTKTTSIKMAATSNDKQLIAEQISDNYLNAQNLTTEIKGIDTSKYTDEQLEAYDKTVAFADSTEYYILILENIAYLAASDTDYSMLADTFLYFALDSQNKMEDARISIQALE